MRLRVRYQAMQSRGPDDNVEANIVHTDATLDLDPRETALVLVDTWGGHPIRSHQVRTAEIMDTKLRPVVEAARRTGITCVYAPSAEVARNYRQWVRCARDEEPDPAEPPQEDWPPADYRAAEGKYASLRRAPGETPPGFQGPYPDWWHIQDIHAPIAPRPEDCVVSTGEHLHRLLRDRKLVHLVYAGFATNMCVRFRDYGLRAMHARGYQPILLRDCTTAIETRETIDDLLITRVVLLDVERWYFSTGSDAFLEACAQVAS